MRSTYTTCATLLVVFIGCISLGEQFYTRIISTRPLGSDEITAFERRFVQVKKDLPTHGAIGYATNKVEGSFKEYTLTVYTLSPVMPVPGPNNEVIIGNFGGPVQSWKLPWKNSMPLFRNYGNGIALFRKPEK